MKEKGLSTLRLRKTGLCAYDVKRFVLDDNVHTLAHGHWRIKEVLAGAPSEMGVEA